MERQDLARIIITGVTLGVAAGIVVWFLERFETNRLVDQLRADLDQWGTRLQRGTQSDA